MFPTLFQLAAKSAAQGIHNDNIPIDFSSDTKSSNAVVRELLELDPKNIEKLKTHKNQLSRLRELDLRKCEIDGEGISNLKNFTLNSLDFGELHHLKAKFPVPIYYGRINIVSLLERALNAHSQEMIIHLGFSGMEEFQIGWEEKISKLLPSLQSIKIIHKVFSEPCGFSNLCISFPNLRTLDISSARCVSTLKGIQNIKSLQKLVMRNVRIEDSDGYKELSELKNLRVLVVSDEDNRNVNSRVRVIRSLLQAEVRMPSLEFLDCSMTSVEDHELKLFVEHHPSLKTVVAISTRCENSHISTINLLNCLTTHSTMKSLEYAISNDRDRLAESCIVFIGKKLNIIHNQLKDSEISEFLNTLCYVLKESKNDMVKAFAISCFSIASFFGTERFIELFWLETPGMVELIFKSWENFKCSAKRESVFSLVLTIFERMINFWKMGKILQDRLLQFIMEKTVELSCVYSGYIHRVTSILIEAHRFMSLDLYTTLFMDRKMVKGLFDFAHYLIKLDPQSYQRILELYVRYLYQASKEMLNYLVSNCQAVEKCYEQVMMISQLPTKEAQKNLAEMVLRLIWVIDTNGFRNPSDKSRALMFCSTLSILLAKNLIVNREDVNTKIKDFNDSWGQSSLLDCPKMSANVFKTILNSEHSTDQSIHFGFLLMHTYINVECFLESKELWNWMKTISEWYRNSRKATKNTRESTAAILDEMRMVEKQWWSQFLPVSEFF
ncbi:Protein CBG03663 [Caenorhabditis briggsae]|uniref:Protein CBG03663 n=1 Tax=Caenorhabditis briggsae TaxID=6238 RepID=A8WVJ4_CAEBR|nr:Protein CBG03663 [Caenorhabditis briggsae]CAP24505.2 Protein CBG03663 [Caenorhabditis briggsae]